MSRFGLYSSRVLVDDSLVRATIVVENGKIAAVIKGMNEQFDFPVEDVGNSVIMPGLIDSHVHINEPGRTDWEGFDTATKAAAAGGITTLVEMPLNANPVTTNKEAFKKKLLATKGKLHINCGFWGGIVPENINELDKLIEEGVLGIKAFLTHSGIDEFPNVSEDDLRKGLPIIKKYNIPLLVHAELTAPHAEQYLLDENPTSYQAYLKSRPKTWEDKAISLMINLAKEYDTHIHIVHLSSANSINTLRQAKTAGIPITVETCPHYLFFNAEDIPNGQTVFKCAPPIRERANNNQLWEALRDGLFSFIVTDHSPAIPAIKEIDSGNLKKAWGGIASLQFSLSAIWTKAKERQFTIVQIVSLMSRNVAKFLNLENKKGQLTVGFDADIVVWNPEKKFKVTEEDIKFRHKISPYIGCQLNGVVEQTYVNGHKVYDNGLFINLAKGKIIKRSRNE